MKTRLLFFLLLFVICTGITLDAQIPTSGLIGNFPFNGNAKDETNSGHNGIVFGSTLAIDRCSKHDSAYHFNGKTNFIKVTNNNINTLNFTYAVWMYMEPIPADSLGYYIMGVGTIPHVKYGTCLGISKMGYGRAGFTVTSGNTDGTYVGLTTDSMATAYKWYLMVVTRSNTEVKIYINNIFKVSAPTYGKIPFFNNPLDIFIGTRGELFDFFKGSIDDIKMYNRVLSDAEIENLYYSECNSKGLSQITGTRNVCKGQQNVNFSVEPLQSASYSWSYSGTGANISGSGNNISINFDNNSTSGILRLVSTLSNSQIESAEFQITIIDLPGKPGEILGQQGVCKESNNSYFINPVNYATNYLWQFSGGGSVVTGNSDSINIFFSDQATDGSITVTGKNNCGFGTQSDPFPVSIISCQATIPSNLNIPNAITPNGDQYNDYFFIDGLPPLSSLLIFDRLGNKLFESKDYKNNWDGLDEAGNKLESGTYWYVLRLKGIPTEFKGFVFIKR